MVPSTSSSSSNPKARPAHLSNPPTCASRSSRACWPQQRFRPRTRRLTCQRTAPATCCRCGRSAGAARQLRARARSVAPRSAAARRTLLPLGCLALTCARRQLAASGWRPVVAVQRLRAGAARAAGFRSRGSRGRPRARSAAVQPAAAGRSHVQQASSPAAARQRTAVTAAMTHSLHVSLMYCESNPILYNRTPALRTWTSAMHQKHTRAPYTVTLLCKHANATGC